MNTEAAGKTVRIRGGRGLGDSIYLRPIVEHFVRSGYPVTALSDYPDVFIGSGADVQPFTRTGPLVLAHYTQGKSNPTTTQFADMCRSASIPVMPLHFRWEVRNTDLVESVKAKADFRRIIVVQGGRPPMNRTDGFGAELLPKRAAFVPALVELRKAGCFLVQIGKADEIYSLPGDLDLRGKTSVSDLLDLAQIAHGFMGQCSYLIPLAEAFDKCLLIVFAAEGFASKHVYIRQITPTKVLSKASSKWVVDNHPDERISEVTREAFAL